MEFKDRIRELRLERDITKTQLAVEVGLREAGVNAWELGRTKPNVDTLIKLAKIFDCSTDYLLGLTDYRNNAEQHDEELQINELSQFLLDLPPRHKDHILNIDDNLKIFCKALSYREPFVDLYLNALRDLSKSMALLACAPGKFKIESDFQMGARLHIRSQKAGDGKPINTDAEYNLWLKSRIKDRTSDQVLHRYYQLNAYSKDALNDFVNCLQAILADILDEVYIDSSCNGDLIISREQYDPSTIETWMNKEPSIFDWIIPPKGDDNAETQDNS